jgi:ABC-2 type transport system permease protein
MLKSILAFEVKFWLRGWMVWIFLLVIAAMIFGAVSSDNVTVGSALENTKRNAPFVILNFYTMISLLTLLMTTAFVNGAATRDFHHRTHEIIFSTPVGKWQYLIGRFTAAALVSLVPAAGVTLGALAGVLAPWLDMDRWGPVYWSSHLSGFALFALPNTIFTAAVMFAVAALTRSTVASFLSALLLLVAYGVSGTFTGKLDTEWIAAMLDPFGIQAFQLVTKYWTVADKNTQAVTAAGLLLWNRLLWTSAGLLIFALTGLRFRMAERTRRLKKRPAPPAESSVPRSVEIPATPLSFTGAANWRRLLGLIKAEAFSIARTTSFLVLAAAALLNMVPTLIFNAGEGYGVSSLPVTYRILEIIRGSMYLFLVVILTYFAGALVWRERDARMDEIHDALPVPGWLAYLAKLLALAGVVALIQCIAIACGVSAQAGHGYTRFQLGLYLKELLLADYVIFLCLGTLAFFVHAVSPNKYIGYAIYVVCLILNFFIWRPLDIESNMVQFASFPSYKLSDFYFYAPFVKGLLWFGAYWLLFCGLLVLATVLFWPRGQRQAIRQARARLSRPFLTGAALVSVAWAPVAGWVFYNTKLLNPIITREEGERRRAGYEKQYKQYQGLTQPRVREVKYDIAIYPERRAIRLQADQVLENPYAEPIRNIHFTLASPNFDYHIELPGSRLLTDDKRLLYRIYELDSPILPGRRISMRSTVSYEPRGFENNTSQLEFVQNGAFFNSSIVPQIGYQPSHELEEKNRRRKLGLPERSPMPPLQRNCSDACRNSYMSNNSDWVSVETVISTSPDQIAVAPGSLLREWSRDGRRFFHYKLDHHGLNFYSFISARYQVARQNWNGVKLEVYFHPEHKWNVDKMLRGMAQTLDYGARNFSPYAPRQARIIEFPRRDTFAQAFPGTMPYSEAIGFIANLKDPEDIDHVFYVTAHEVGHQWWAYQVIGANMEGATLLSETMAQYTALMVMEKQYGRDMMRKFLAYEMDNYLKARGGERLREQPLLKVNSDQGYVHYRKGSVVMYYLKEMIGEEAINRALRRLLARFAYKGPPYPTSHDLVEELRAETPAHLRYLVKDLFEDITLFAGRTLTATAKKTTASQYQVAIEVEAKKLKADAEGNESEVPLNDWIEIGAFAKPEKDKKFGRTLYRRRVLMTQSKNRYTFQVNEEPAEAGIDPFAMLVDRVPKDNMKKVEIAQ